jgi:hypothetical protein
MIFNIFSKNSKIKNMLLIHLVINASILKCSINVSYQIDVDIIFFSKYQSTKKKKGVNGPKAQRRKIREQSETKLLGDQAIERKGQNIWPTNTEISWLKGRDPLKTEYQKINMGDPLSPT